MGKIREIKKNEKSEECEEKLKNLGKTVQSKFSI